MLKSMFLMSHENILLNILILYEDLNNLEILCLFCLNSDFLWQTMKLLENLTDVKIGLMCCIMVENGKKS